MARQQIDPKALEELEHPRPQRHGGGRGRLEVGVDDGSTMMHLRPEDFGEEFARERYAGGHGESRPLEQARRDAYDRERLGYGRRRGQARPDSGYDAQDRRPQRDEEPIDPAYLRRGTGQYGYGGSIAESDYRRWGRRHERGSGGGYGTAGGYGAMGDYGAEGLWRGDASQGGRGGTSPNPWEARPGPFAGQGPKGYVRSDDRIYEDVCERLARADDVDVHDVGVKVSGGQVLLEGNVPNRWMKYRIEDICEKAPGVSDIENRIRIDRSGQQQRPVAPAPY